MEINEIKKDIYYNILKNFKAKFDFEKIEKYSRKKFTYKYNKNISISHTNKSQTKYSYNYFFDENQVLKENLSDLEKFIVKVCEIDLSLSCTNDITEQEWVIEYCNLPIYRCYFLNILNLSSIDFMIPMNLNIFDFEHTFIEILNENSNAIWKYQAINIIKDEINIKESTLEDFLNTIK